MVVHVHVSVGRSASVCLCVSENLSESRICYFIGIQFELSLFFPVHMRFLPVKMNFFLLFAIVHCCNSCCCCGCFWCSMLFLFLLQTQPPTVWDLKASLLLYLSTYVCNLCVCVCSAPELTPVLIHVHIRIHIRIHIGIITFYLNFYFTLFDLISLSHFQFKLPMKFTTSPGTFGLLWFAGCVCKSFFKQSRT